MKELGELRRYLGCRIDRNREERLIYISQGDFITRSLEKYGYKLQTMQKSQSRLAVIPSASDFPRWNNPTGIKPA